MDIKLIKDMYFKELDCKSTQESRLSSGRLIYLII